MVSAFTVNSHPLASSVIFSTDRLFDRDLNFGKTWNTDSVVINSKGSIEMSERAVFRSIGRVFEVKPPFYCDYGCHIYAQENLDPTFRTSISTQTVVHETSSVQRL